MSLRYLESHVLTYVAKSALKLEFLLTTVATILGAVVLFGIFGLGGDDSFASLFGDFLAISTSSLWLMFGLVALSYQLHTGVICDEETPSTTSAFSFAWGRAKAIVVLPAWGVAVLLLLLLGEVLLFSLANIPGVGSVWLAIIAIPLLILNTFIAILLMLSVFNIAAYVALSDADVGEMRQGLWSLVKERFVELLVYNLGGLLLTLIVASLVLSPLWLGAQATFALIDYAAVEPWNSLVEASGFWGSIAHFIGLVMSGLLLAAIGAVPIVVITHVTLLVHMELAPSDEESFKETSKEEVIDVEMEGENSPSDK